MGIYIYITLYYIYIYTFTLTHKDEGVARAARDLSHQNCGLKIVKEKSGTSSPESFPPCLVENIGRPSNGVHGDP